MHIRRTIWGASYCDFFYQSEFALFKKIWLIFYLFANLLTCQIFCNPQINTSGSFAVICEPHEQWQNIRSSKRYILRWGWINNLCLLGSGHTNKVLFHFLSSTLFLHLYLLLVILPFKSLPRVLPKSLSSVFKLQEDSIPQEDIHVL